MIAAFRHAGHLVLAFVLCRDIVERETWTDVRRRAPALLRKMRAWGRVTRSSGRDGSYLSARPETMHPIATIPYRSRSVREVRSGCGQKRLVPYPRRAPRSSADYAHKLACGRESLLLYLVREPTLGRTLDDWCESWERPLWAKQISHLLALLENPARATPALLGRGFREHETPAPYRGQLAWLLGKFRVTAVISPSSAQP